MMILALSSAFVGLVHSLAPGHWLPVVLMAKTKRWSMQQAAFGAIVAASGHILVSLSLGLLASLIGHTFFEGSLHKVEENAGWILVVFGIFYAIYSRFQHRHCNDHDHGHHGPKPKKETAPYLFLFSLGFSPCFAVLPLFATAVGMGSMSLMVVMVTFSLGVLTALVGGSLLVARGLVKLDHPILDHYGELITGLGVAAMGAFLLLFPHVH
jgi:nickel/cobalt exporter